MNINLLKSCAEAYIIDNKLYDKVNEETLFNNLLLLKEELYNNDITLYHMFNELSVYNQRKLIKEYFDISYKNQEQPLNEIIEFLTIPILNFLGNIFWGLGVVSVLLILDHMFNLAGRSVRIYVNFLYSFGKVIQSVGSWIKTKGAYFQFRYAILRKNAAVCYKNCKIDFNENQLDDFAAFYVQHFKKRLLPVVMHDAKEQGECLSVCFIESTLESLKLLYEDFFYCVRKTGKYKSFDLGPDNILKIITSLDLNKFCESYFKDLRKITEDYYKLLDYVFPDSELKRQEYVFKLRDELVKVKDKVYQPNYQQK